ncbi:hypothetical protein BAUCODRAFT_468572 [Baudoinia panamericana UAMH 10762]|uniref:Uncharacterized protein n=1 Tax=Baudoinia panamericana (strain UAMH 10762) TaxID=717646 RepID=M2NAW1_BAUPA|nr:uncharacterized protein BAUCODRAFT_468572 [Baudoinia panamericana UAMH 10762]EMC96284.1 hypothetical protein BAUCODRAFT_468572 [Baudoinia panamericana UAMH 10762]
MSEHVSGLTATPNEQQQNRAVNFQRVAGSHHHQTVEQSLVPAPSLGDHCAKHVQVHLALRHAHQPACVRERWSIRALFGDWSRLSQTHPLLDVTQQNASDERRHAIRAEAKQPSTLTRTASSASQDNAESCKPNGLPRARGSFSGMPIRRSRVEMHPRRCP